MLKNTGGMTAKKLHEIIAELMDRSPLSRWETATWLGCAFSNVISMFRTGATKVPITKVPPLTRILDADPVWLPQRALDTSPWSGKRSRSVNKVEIVVALSAAAGDANPRFGATIAKAKLL